MLRDDNQQVSTKELERVIFELKMELAGENIIWTDRYTPFNFQEKITK